MCENVLGHLESTGNTVRRWNMVLWCTTEFNYPVMLYKQTRSELTSYYDRDFGSISVGADEFGFIIIIDNRLTGKHHIHACNKLSRSASLEIEEQG